MINGVHNSVISGQTAPAVNRKASAQGFGQMLHAALNQVNDAQQHADEMTTRLITGDVKNLHDVMIATEKASVALQLTVQVRDKAIEAYQEVMRMQI